MIAEFVSARDDHRHPLYPFVFLEQLGAYTKRYIDDVFTVSLASQFGDINLHDVIFCGSTVCHGGEALEGILYPFLRGSDGAFVPTSVALTRDQVGHTVYR